MGLAGVGPGQPALQPGQNPPGQGMHPLQTITPSHPRPRSGKGRGQITRSGHPARVARSVWIRPARRRGELLGLIGNTAHTGVSAPRWWGSGSRCQSSSNKLSHTPATGAGLADVLGRSAQGHGVDADHRRTGGVNGVQPESVGPGAGQLDMQPGGRGGMQGDPGERERKPRPARHLPR